MKAEQFSLKDISVQKFISQNSKSVFSSMEWYKVLEDTFNSKILIWGLKNGGNLQLIVSGILLDFKIVRIFYSNIPYGGFIGEEAYIHDFLPLLEKELKKAGIDVFRVCKQFTDNYDNLDGYKWQTGCQQIINIEGLSEQGLWDGYKKRVRRDIRRAEKLGVTIKELSDREEIEILFKLYTETMKRKKTYSIWNRNTFYSIYDNLILDHKAEVLFAKLKDEYIAGTISIYSEETLYYFMSSSATNYLSFSPNDLLLHRIITAGIQKNKKYIDLMTSKESDTALIKFKEKWGAECYPFFIFEKNLSCIKAGIWNCAQKAANSRIGAHLFNVVHRK